MIRITRKTECVRIIGIITKGNTTEEMDSFDDWPLWLFEELRDFLLISGSSITCRSNGDLLQLLITAKLVDSSISTDRWGMLHTMGSSIHNLYEYQLTGSTPIYCSLAVIKVYQTGCPIDIVIELDVDSEPE